MNHFLKMTLLIVLSWSFSNCRTTSSQTTTSVPLSTGNVTSIETFSGTFDPPHAGHVQVVTIAKAKVKPDFIYVVPNIQNPAKPKMLPYKYRKEMVAIAFQDMSQILLPDQEIEEKFQSDNLQPFFELLRRRHGKIKLYHVIGDDVLERPNLKLYDSDDVTYLVAIRNGTKNLPKLIHSRIIFFDTGVEGCSSTRIRNGIAEGERNMPCEIPRVMEYIRQNRLYR